MSSCAAELRPFEDEHQPLMGLAALMTMAYSGVDLAPLGKYMVERATLDENDANALMDLSIILQLRGDGDVAMDIQNQALALQQVYRLPAATDKPALRLLAIKGPGEIMWNTPLEFLVQGSDVTLEMLYVTPDKPMPRIVPDHDVMIVAVSESDRNRALLEHLENHVRSWPRPVINAPERINRLSRDNAWLMLGSIDGVVMPVSLRIERALLEQCGEKGAAAGSAIDDDVFPILLRPVDSQAGRGLARIEERDAIHDYLKSRSEEEFFVSRFIDYRSDDGLFRKYRVVFIDGQPFICHMAISEHWMVHYVNAGMTGSAGKREEEARFMEEFDHGFARRHGRALEEICRRVGLGYFAIDCAETPGGELLVFEVGNAMVVHAMDAMNEFSYKQAHMRRVFDAFRGMLADSVHHEERP